MKIYLGHATAFDYHANLYQPLKASPLWHQHTWILPHEKGTEVTHSKAIISECDWLMAEVSYPSTGLGIELGWANALGCKILCFHHENAQPSASLNSLNASFFSYHSSEAWISKLMLFFEKECNYLHPNIALSQALS